MENVVISLQEKVRDINESIGINTDKIAIGTYAGATNQGLNSTSIGVGAGSTNQGLNSIAIGKNSGNNTQSQNAIAIGYEAGTITQGEKSIAIGYYAGRSNQNTNSVAIGNGAGVNSQLTYSIAVGDNAGAINQNSYSVALGNRAGNLNQGEYSVAIGNKAGMSNQHSNSIVLNASDTQLDASNNSGFFVDPISLDIAYGGTNLLFYNTNTKEIKYSSAKTFVIPHPINKEKYLVHACLEGPEAGVYYRGKGTITDNTSVRIDLPEYVKYIGLNYSINITRIFSGKKNNEQYETSEIEDNSFTVYGPDGSFYWIVFAERQKIEVEPNKEDVSLKGDGPYTYIKN